MAAISQLTYLPTDNIVLDQPFAETSTTQRHRLGERRRGYNATDGAAEFIYLLGVASTGIGSWVTFSPDNWGTTLLAANARGPVAVAMSANVASQYGWYMIYGKVDARAADVADSGRVFIDTVAGVCDDAVVAGDHVLNARWASADDTGVASTGHAEVRITYPHVEDVTS